MNKLLLIGAVAFMLYTQNKKDKTSMDAFLTGSSYNEIYKTQWWG